MATIDYVALSTKVRETIRNNGRSFTLVSKANVLVDASKPWGAVTPNDTSSVVTGIFGSYSSKEIDDDAVRRGDKKILIDGENAITIEGLDRVEDGTQKWSIVDIKEVKPAGTSLLYVFQVRL